MKARRTSICALLAVGAMVLLPQAAGASPTQLSLMQDDAELFGQRGEDPVAAMREMRDLGVDVIRTNVLFYRVYRHMNDRTKPAGFDTSNPDEPLYDWGPTDRIVQLARSNGLRVLLTITGPGPHWLSQRAATCKSNVPCPWEPKPNEFGAFAAAVAKRYRGQVDWYSIYNEPNLKRWIMPLFKRTRYGMVETDGVIYRQLWTAGYKAIAKHDPARRNKVFFGEVAAIGGPVPMLYAALCLDPKGQPFKGRLRTLHKCPPKPAKLNIGGFAIHPYNQGGFGSPHRKTSSKGALPQQYMPRLHRLMDQATRRGRIPRNRGIYITEFGYQTNPPDPVSTISPSLHARYINESDRLFFNDKRVKTVAQYQLVDVAAKEEYNSGLRFPGRAKKPSYDAYRLPIVITKLTSKTVEVYGQVRPARTVRRLMGSPRRPQLQFARGGGSFTTVATPALNAAGIFRLKQSRAGSVAGRWRLRWEDPITGFPEFSRVAKAGKAVRYYYN